MVSFLYINNNYGFSIHFMRNAIFCTRAEHMQSRH